jgi:glucose-1-phosphate adenylyltransferase
MIAPMNDVLTLILGGGRGTRLFPLTHMRSKPAVPIGGKYRLIDIPISNCLHAGLKRIFVLTQFNSASLNRHVAQTYRLDMFSDGFVEVLAAEQTPDSSDWFQGTADAVRQGARHFAGYDADYYLILAGDHLYRMDFSELIDAHIESSADITIAAQPVTPADATQMGIFRFDQAGHINGFEEKPNAARLAEMKSSAPRGSIGGLTSDKPFVASMGIYVFSRDVLLETLERPGIDFGKEIIPAALGSLNVNAFLYRGYWADVGTVAAFYDANIQLTQRGALFNFFHATRPIYTHQRFLPATRTFDSHIDASIVSEGCSLDHCDIRDSVVGIRTSIARGARVTRSVLLGADFFQDEDARTDDVPLGIGENAVLDRVIVDKNARIADGVRLVNESGAMEQDGDGWYIRDGIIVVPKGAVVTKGCC